MAERRMFAKAITESDAFGDMPLSAQALYFHLGMNADDEGFVGNPKRIMRASNAAADDMRILVSRKFVILFVSGVLVIKHWKVNNSIQKDRFHKTNYQNELNQLELKGNKSYKLKTPGHGLMDTECIQDVSKMDTQVSLGKVRLGKKTILSGKPDCSDAVVDYLNAKSGKHFKHTSSVTQRLIAARVHDGYKPDDFKTVIDSQCKEWLSDPHMERYIRPETLFGTKFEGYLNAKGESDESEPPYSGVF